MPQNQNSRHAVNSSETLMRALLRQTALFLLATALLPACAPGQPSNQSSAPAVFSLGEGHQPLTSLNGLWRFKPGDDPQFALPSYDDSAWALLRSDQSWTSQEYKSITGFAWYRFRVVLPASSEYQSLLLPSIASGYQCFIDGKLVHTEGAVKILAPARYSMPAAIELPPADPAQPQTHTVALRVWFNPSLDGSSEGGPGGTNVAESSVLISSLGDSASVQTSLSNFFAAQRQKYSVFFILALLFTLASIMCISLFLMERSSKEYFWYCIASATWGFQLWINFDQFTHGWRISTSLLLGAILGWGTQAALVLFLCYLLNIRRNWIPTLVIFLAFVGNFCVCLQFAGPIGNHTSNLLSAVGNCLFFAWGIFVVSRRAIQRVQDAILLLIPVLLDFGSGLLDALRTVFPNVGTGLEGAFEHVLLTYPFQVKVTDTTSALVLLAFVAVLLRRFDSIQREHARITADMGAARSIQHLLIPPVLPTVSGFRIEAAYHPAQEVGGDFFQVIPAGADKTLIVLGDVSGKGLPAAMTVSMIVGVVRTLVESTTSPADILTGLNTHLLGRGAGFTTCLALEITQDGTLKLANAGHLAPYRNGVEIDFEGGLPLGIMPSLTFPESTLHLVPGDRLTLMTDGILEAASDRELFGFLRTQELSQQSAEHIADAARSFGQTDDITVLSIDFNPAST